MLSQVERQKPSHIDFIREDTVRLKNAESTAKNDCAFVETARTSAVSPTKSLLNATHDRGPELRPGAMW